MSVIFSCIFDFARESTCIAMQQQHQRRWAVVFSLLLTCYWLATGIPILLSFRWGPRWGDEGVRMSELWRIAALFSSPLLLSAGSNARAVRWLVRYRNRITAFCYADTHRHRQILLDNACTENTNTESRTYGAVWSCVDRGAHRYPGHRRSVFRHRAALPGTEHIHIIAMLWKLRND